jgi:hypothetical protein
MDMAMAGIVMRAQCASNIGRAAISTGQQLIFSTTFPPSALLLERIREGQNLPTPITTKNPVQNLPKSMTAFPALSMKSSGFAHRPQIQFGSGAIT